MKRLSILSIISLLFVGIIVCASHLSVSAQTINPSRTAYNYSAKKAKKKHAKKANGNGVKKTAAAARRHNPPAPKPEVVDTAEAKFVIADDKYEYETTPGQQLEIELSVLKKADNSSLTAKLLADYSKSQTATASIDAQTNKLTINSIFPGTRSFYIGSEEFPALRKAIKVTVKKVEVASLEADSTNIELDTAVETNIVIKAKDKDGNAILARLKATSDSQNALLSFPDLANRMTAKLNGKKNAQDVTATIKFTTIDAAKDCGSKCEVAVTVTIKGTDNSTAPAANTNPGSNQAPAATPSPSPTPDPSSQQQNSNSNSNTAAPSGSTNSNSSNSNTSPTPSGPIT